MTTEYSLKKALEMFEERGHETTFWSVRDKKLGFCTHCNYCLKKNGCIIKDDMQELYPLLEQAEALVIATPIYNGAVSAQIKAVMDRTRAQFARNPDTIKGKPGIAIAIGGDRAGGQELAIQQIHTFYILNGALPLSGGFFGANIGASLWSKDTMEGIKEDEEGFRGLSKTIKTLSNYLKAD
jgi:multimeric flavodoxin WrbA